MVTLTQRYTRIDALCRLLRARNEPYDPYRGRGERPDESLQIEQLGGLLRPDDRLFLTDGWDDLLFMLSGEPSEKCLREIFAIQSAFFEDFMVDRTELILAANYIPVAAASRNFQLSVQLRLMEDRILEYKNHEFRERIRANIESSEFWSSVPEERIILCRIPGRTDYIMTFPEIDKHFTDPLSFGMLQLFELFKGTWIDAIQTTIGKKIKLGSSGS